MATFTIAQQFTTMSVSTTGDTLVMRRRFGKFRNLGANVVSITDTTTNPTGAITAGNQTSVNPVPATGKVDEVILFPNTTYLIRAATGATLCALDEIPGEKAEW